LIFVAYTSLGNRHSSGRDSILMTCKRWIRLTGAMLLAIGGSAAPAERVTSAETAVALQKRETWWETMLASREALVEQEVADERQAEAECQADSVLKEFQPLRVECDSQHEPRKIRVRIAGMKRLYLGSAGQTEAFLADPQVVGRDGKAAALTMANRIEMQPPLPEGEKRLREAIAKRFGAELAGQPYAGLVNVANPAESRVLMRALPAASGGWGQIAKGAFSGRNDPDWQEFLKLVEGSITPLKNHDIAGTCGRKQGCSCGGCFARRDLAARKSTMGDAP